MIISRIFLTFVIFCASCSNQDQKITSKEIEKYHCSLSIDTADGNNLSVSTNKDEKCIRLTYGTVGLEWPVLTNVSYHLKDGRNVIGKSPKPSTEEFDESSLRAFQSWITLSRIMEDVKFTKLNPEEISWFQIFSTRNKDIVSNKCLLLKDDSEIGYVLSCEKPS